MPGKGRQHANRPLAEETLELTPPTPSAKAPKAKRKSNHAHIPTRLSPRKQPRLHTNETKLAIFQVMLEWHNAGQNKADSPIQTLVTKYGCDRSYPTKLYKLVYDRGTIDNRWGPGRPVEIDEAVWGEMVSLIRQARSKQKRASSTEISAKLRKRMPRKKTPSPRTVRAKKAAMGFKIIKIKKKPKLSTEMMRLRNLFAQQHMNRCFNSTVVLDEKWFSEEKVKGQCIEARSSSPLKGEQFKHKQSETDTQRTKIMYSAAVTGQHKIWLYELD